MRNEVPGILYGDIPRYFTWKRGWSRRSASSKALRRLHFVDPKNVKFFYLRLLLLHLTDAKSFEDIRQVRGIQYDTYKEAATALGLAADDEELTNCLNEAAQMRSPFSLRNLLAILCGFFGVVSPMNLLEQFKVFLCEDFASMYMDDDVAYSLCCQELDNILRTHNTSFRQVFGLESQHSPGEPLGRREDMILEFDLNEEQQQTFDIIKSALEDRSDTPKVSF